MVKESKTIDARLSQKICFFSGEQKICAETLNFSKKLSLQNSKNLRVSAENEKKSYALKKHDLTKMQNRGNAHFTCPIKCWQ